MLRLGFQTCRETVVSRPVNAIAQAWNAALAGIGASEFNAQAASRTNAIVFRPPKGLKSDYEKHAEDVLKKRDVKK